MNPEHSPQIRRFKEEDEEAIKCPNCQGTFFAEIKVNRFKAGEAGVPGQTLPRLNDLDFPVYLCVTPGCGHATVLEPDGSVGGRRGQLYNRLCDTILGTQKEEDASYQGLHSHLESIRLADEEKANQ